MKNINFVALFWDSWKILKKNPLFILFVIGTYFLSWIIQSFLGNIFGQASLTSSLLSFLVTAFVGIIIMKIALDLSGDNRLSIASALSNPQKLLKAVVVYLLMLFIILGGLILLIIPGIYFLLRLQYSVYFYLDKNIGVIDSLKASWNATRGNLSNVLAFSWLSIGVSLLGLVVFLVGVLVSLPVVLIATALFYRKLQS